VLAASIGFTVVATRDRGRGTAPVHLAVPPPEEAAGPAADPHTLRVCADPNNLPFSNRRREGFENRIADVVARDLGRHVEYYWQPQRRGFVRTTLAAGRCDVIVGVPSSFELTRVTRPYYRSSFMFVTRRGMVSRVRSLDDPRLRRLRIGIELTGDDYDNPPAAQALAARHITDNVHGYLVYGDYSKPHPSWGVMDAVASGEVDLAIAWGPLAGFYARHSRVALDLRPVAPAIGTPSLPFVFDISMGVRRGDADLAARLDKAIRTHKREIDAILAAYGVPVAPGEGVQG
jgi:mxaJ protein